jgi:hypothetical protein
VDFDAAFGQRQGNPPGPDGQFENRSGASVLSEERNRAVRILGENLWPLVVDSGKAVTVSRWSVLPDDADITSGVASVTFRLGPRARPAALAPCSTWTHGRSRSG